MKDEPRKVFERVYIHAAKVKTTEGWILVIHSMDAFSEFVFEPVFSNTSQITKEDLNKLFDNILKTTSRYFIPNKLLLLPTFLRNTKNLSIQQTKAAHHRFIYDKNVTAKATKGFFNNFSLN